MSLASSARKSWWKHHHTIKPIHTTWFAQTLPIAAFQLMDTGVGNTQGQFQVAQASLEARRQESNALLREQVAASL